MNDIVEEGGIIWLGMIGLLIMVAGVLLTWVTNNLLFYILVGVGTVVLIFSLCITINHLL